MKKLIFFITGMVCLASSLHAQSPPDIRPLHIGDTVPDITLNHIINYKTPAAKLSDFRGKLLILDFWATWCSPCVAMIPKMHELQDSFKREVQFLPVAYQDSKTVNLFLNKTQKLFHTNEPSVTGDKILSKLFPHKTLPHYVWIGDNGKIRAITGLEEISYSNIRSVLKDKNFVLPIKKDSVIAYDKTKPLFFNGNGGDGQELIYHSLFSKYVEGISSGLTVYDKAHGGKIIERNEAILWLLNLAYGEGKQNFPFENQVILDVKDSSRYLSSATGTKYGEWARKNTYCYELIVPSFLYDQRYKIMQGDIKRLFPEINVTIENRRALCLVLTLTGKDDKLLSKGGKPETSITPLSCHIQNKPLSLFFKILKVIYLQNSPIPLVDGTNLKSNIDLDISANLSNVVSINNALHKFNLRLVKEYRTIPFLVVRDQTTL